MLHRRFFSRVDRILRRSLGVSETAKTDASVKPAPPVASVPVEEEELSFDDTHMQFDPEMQHWIDATRGVRCSTEIACAAWHRVEFKIQCQ